MTLRFDIRAFDEVTSTNDIVKEAASRGEPEGFAVCAKVQTAGYGRRGNAWKSESGSLYLSLLLRPDASGARMSTLPLAAALAVRRAVASFLPEGSKACVMVKWPNDVVVRDARLGVPAGSFAKVCGISTELKSGAVCVGIGVNVLAPRRGNGDGGLCRPGAGACVANVAAAVPSFRNRPTYLSELVPEGACPSVAQVRDAVLDAFAAVYDEWLARGFAPLRQEYLQHFALLGRAVRVDEPTAHPAGSEGDTAPSAACATLRGTVAGVTDDGRLLVDRCDSPGDGPCLFEVASGSITMEA